MTEKRKGVGKVLRYGGSQECVFGILEMGW